MKKLLLVFAISVLALSTALAQRTISGMVTDDVGEPLIGANILVKGMTVGTVTDLDGKYSLTVPEGGEILLFSYTGYASQEIPIGTSNVIDVELEADSELLGEVVVTALGLERERKELGYSVTTVDGEEVTKVRSSNVLENLSGRVPGVRINASSGTAGGSVNVLIRGANSLGGGNGPLFVIDGTPVSNSAFNGTRNEIIAGGADVGSRAADINPDDIASISVLKGGSAIALYGQRARDGVVLITTKRAKEGQLQVDVNSSLRFSQPLRLPDFQNEYASGDFGIYNADAFTNGWGPRIADLGNDPVRQFPFDEERPLQAQPDNVKDFFETGVQTINSLAIGSKGTAGDIRLSYSFLDDQSFVPENRLKRHTVGLNGGTSFGNRITARTSINYVNTEGFNRPRQGSNNPSILLSNIYGIPRTISTDDLRNNVVNENGEVVGLDGNRTSNNPYWILENNPFNNVVDRVYGNLELGVEILPWLNLLGRFGTDFYTEKRRDITAKGTLGAVQGQYIDRDIFRREFTSDIILRAARDLTSSISMNALVGWNNNDIYFENSRVAAVDLVAPEVYTPANAFSVANTRNETQRRLIGGYFDFGFGYNDYLFVNLTGRNDWSSTLPKNNNSYFYPGVSSSFIFSEAFNIDKDVLSYGKFRVSWVQVGNDEAPYQLDFLFDPQADIFTQFVANNTFPIGGQPAFAGPNTLPAGQNLEPQKQTQFEIGTELQFFKGRIQTDLTYYRTVTSNQILSVQVAQSTGFEAVRQNVGEVSNQGFEGLLSVTPIQTDDLKWNVYGNFTYNRQQVDELSEGLDELALTSGFSGLSIRAEPGEPFGLYGSGWERNDAGELIIDPSTGLRIAGDRTRLGNIYPDWQLGVGTEVTYKGFSFSALVDASIGGVMFSRTVSALRGAGLAEETLENRGQVFIDEGVNELADGTFVPNQTPVQSMQDFWGNYTNNSNTEGSVFDSDYVKLREVQISYDLSRVLPSDFFRNISIGVEARNLWLIHSKVPHIDPEASFFGPSLTGGGANIEFWSIPSARSIGLNVRAGF